MKKIKTIDAVGCTLCHDIARIVVGSVKDTPFRRGHVVQPNDVPVLQSLGKEHLFVMEEEDMGKIHEEDVAVALFDLCKNTYIKRSEVREGKIEAIADTDGLFMVDVKRLNAINSIGQLTIVTRPSYTTVRKGEKVAGMRCIPLMLEPWELEKAKEIGNHKPLFDLKPFVLSKVGIVTTGTEVYTGKIKDAFTPIIEKRIAPFGMHVVAHETVPDDINSIKEAILHCKKEGAHIIFCTGGMSVDPDDLTPGAIRECAEEWITYGLPVLPGSMFCISYMKDGTPLIGVPGGVLFSEPTAFDLLLPRFAAAEKMTKEDCVALGHGGFLP